MANHKSKNLLVIISNPYGLYPLLETLNVLGSTCKVYVVFSNRNFSKYDFQQTIIDYANFYQIDFFNIYSSNGYQNLFYKIKELIYIYKFCLTYKKLKFDFIFSHASTEMFENLIINYFSNETNKIIGLWPLTLNIDESKDVKAKPKLTKIILDIPKYYFENTFRISIFLINKYIFKYIFKKNLINWQNKYPIGVLKFDLMYCANNKIKQDIENNFLLSEVKIVNFNCSPYKNSIDRKIKSALINLSIHENFNFLNINFLQKIKSQINCNSFIIRLHPTQKVSNEVFNLVKYLNSFNFNVKLTSNYSIHQDFLIVDYFISEPSSSFNYALGFFSSQNIFGFLPKPLNTYPISVIRQLSEHFNWNSAINSADLLRLSNAFQNNSLLEELLNLIKIEND